MALAAFHPARVSNGVLGDVGIHELSTSQTYAIGSDVERAVQHISRPSRRQRNNHIAAEYVLDANDSFVAMMAGICQWGAAASSMQAGGRRGRLK